MPWVGFKPTISVFERGDDSSWLTPRGHCDRQTRDYDDIIKINFGEIYYSKVNSVWGLFKDKTGVGYVEFLDSVTRYLIPAWPCLLLFWNKFNYTIPPSPLLVRTGAWGINETSPFTSVSLSRTVGWTPWMSDQLIARPLPTQDNINVLTYWLMYGAEPFLRSCQSCSHSENSQQF
jgi:hypothetical protein